MAWSILVLSGVGITLMFYLLRGFGDPSDQHHVRGAGVDRDPGLADV